MHELKYETYSECFYFMKLSAGMCTVNVFWNDSLDFDMYHLSFFASGILFKFGRVEDDF